jgi:hypothetical protein
MDELRRERRLRRRGWTVAAVAVVLVWATPALSETIVPHEFTAGTPARANEINENFVALARAIDAVDAATDTRLDALEALLLRQKREATAAAARRSRRGGR